MEVESSQGGKTKEKKTRRRLRLSCVECTKRRQKCDRKHPCSLCVTRGVSHLCRWETVPLARPTPARPPQSALQEIIAPSDQTALIAELRKRIGTLEHELEQARDNTYSPSVARSTSSRTHSTPPFSGTEILGPRSTVSPVIPTEYPQSQSSQHSSPPPLHLGEYSQRQADDVTEICPRPYPLDEDTYEATATLAQLSLAHHGEFIGRGSLICALHSMTSTSTPRFLYAKSTEPMSLYRPSAQKFSNVPFASNIDELIPHVPAMVVVETLTTAFFNETNWRYGIPEEWFRGARSQMWASLRHPHSMTSQINANWLMLLFAILASAPRSAHEEVQQFSPSNNSDDYFMYAMMARRIVEDDFLNVPSASFMVSAADGTVVGCLATPLLCDYLAGRGRISEAWKLIGHAIRNAMSVGLHRDPEWKLWQMMSADEKLLRRRAWWGLFMSDKIYSAALGRPQVLRPGVYDVDLYGTRDSTGSRNIFHFGQNITIRLMELLGDALERCFTAHFPDCVVYFEMDRRFQDWEDQLPPEYQIQIDLQHLQDFTPAEVKILAHQRYTLHTWYLTSRLKLFIASSVGIGRENQPALHMLRTKKECVYWSIRVIHFQCAAYATLSRPTDDPSGPIYPGDCWLFEGCFSLFEASVALMTVLSQLDWPEKVAEARHAIDTALFTFEQVTRREQDKKGETAARAIEVLLTIQKQHWPDSNFLRLSKIKEEPDTLDRSATTIERISPDSNLILSPYMPPTPFARNSLQDGDHSSHFLGFS